LRLSKKHGKMSNIIHLIGLNLIQKCVGFFISFKEKGVTLSLQHVDPSTLRFFPLKTMPSDAPPSSSMDLIASPKVKTTEGEKGWGALLSS